MNVYSYDLWDTLIGRWYNTPDSIFEEVQKTLDFPNFVYKRKHSERITGGVHIADFYRFFRENFDDDRALINRAWELEVQLELERSFTIPALPTNVGKPYIIVSDFYMDSYIVNHIIDVRGLIPIELFLSSHGKSSGTIWKDIKKKYSIIEHWGDNPQSDFSIAVANGIPAMRYTGTSRTNIETKLVELGASKLSNFIRMIRLLNPHVSRTPNDELWREQADINLPILICFSRLIAEARYENILFTQRDSNLLEKLYKALYPTHKVQSFYSSRITYTNPTQTFDEYVKRIYEKTPQPLIVDLQGTGDSCYSYFSRFNICPDYFVLVDSDRNTKNYCNKRFVVRYSSGYSDKIEYLNYDNVGKVIDVDSMGNPIREAFEDNPYIKSMHTCIPTAIEYINKKYDLDETFDYKGVIKYLLWELEQRGASISKYVPHTN